MSRGFSRFSPSERNFLEALLNHDLRWKDLKLQVKNGDGGPITDRGLTKARKKLVNLGYLEKRGSSRTTPYGITQRGREELARDDFIRSMEDKDRHYSNEILFQVAFDPIHWEGGFKILYPYLDYFDNFASPLPVQASFFTSEEVGFMADFAQWHHVGHDHADVRELPNLLLEENIRPLKPYLNETILNRCCLVGEQYEDYLRGNKKKKPKLDINALDFDWGVALRFEGKQILRKIRERPNDPEILKIKKEIEERLVGTLLLYLRNVYQPGCDFLIPAMVEGKIIDKKEGRELQELYEKIHGKLRIDKGSGSPDNRFYGSPGREEAKRLLLIGALKHLKNGKGILVPKTGVHGIEDAGLTEDDVFNKIVKIIEKPE